MDREELNALLRGGPCRIRMNDGLVYDAENFEMAMVSDIAAYVLRRCDDGKLRTIVLPLVTMAAVEPLYEHHGA